MSPSSLERKTSTVDFQSTKAFEDDITKTTPSDSTITSTTAFTSNQSEDTAKNIFQRAAKAIPSEWRSTFVSSGSLRSTLVRIQSENESTTVHVLVQNVTEDQIDEVIYKLSFKRMTRVWVEIDSAIITIMPGLKHEITCTTFSNQIMFAIATMPGHDTLSVLDVRAARFHCPGKRSKEGDNGLMCPTRSGKGIEWPNLMIEVGHAEPLCQLRIDAEWWLINSGGLTRMVIIILVSDSPDALDIEVWELGPNPRRESRNTPTTVPTATNKLQINGAANVNPANASLTIPYAVLFDNDHPSAADVVFSHVQLSKMANHIFRHT